MIAEFANHHRCEQSWSGHGSKTTTEPSPPARSGLLTDDYNQKIPYFDGLTEMTTKMFEKSACSSRNQICSASVVFGVLATCGSFSAGATYFVATTGHNINYGTSENDAFKTISYAIHMANQNNEADTIHVKAGLYDESNDLAAFVESGKYYFDSEGLVVNEGSLQIVGYEQSVGDLDTGSGVPSGSASMGQISDMVNVSGTSPPTGFKAMPAIVSSDYVGTSMLIEADDVQIKNFWIDGKAVGLHIKGTQAKEFEGCIVENLVFRDQGNPEVSGTGIAIWFQYCNGDNSLNENIIKNCRIINASNCGILFHYSEDNTIEGCHVYSNDATSTHGETDYYYDIAWSQDNTVKDCIAERKASTNSHRHGFIVQNRPGTTTEVSSGNVFSDCMAFDMAHSFALQGNVTGNTVVECESHGSTSMINAWGALLITSGPVNNKFRRLRSYSPTIGVLFEHQNSFNPNADFASSSNSFDNCIFANVTKKAIQFSHYLDRQNTNEVEFTSFLNCTFTGDTNVTPAPVFCINDRLGLYNQVTNCIVKGFGEFEKHETGGPNDQPSGLTFDYCCFHDVSSEFDAPTVEGSGNIEAGPVMTNIAPDYDYNLLMLSPCINAGDPNSGALYSLLNLLPTTDVDGDDRSVGGYDIGAQEYQSGGGGGGGSQ